MGEAAKLVNKIALIMEEDFYFSVPDEDGRKVLQGNKDAWERLQKLVEQIMQIKDGN